MELIDIAVSGLRINVHAIARGTSDSAPCTGTYCINLSRLRNFVRILELAIAASASRVTHAPYDTGPSKPGVCGLLPSFGGEASQNSSIQSTLLIIIFFQSFDAVYGDVLFNI